MANDPRDRLENKVSTKSLLAYFLLCTIFLFRPLSITGDRARQKWMYPVLIIMRYLYSLESSSVTFLYRKHFPRGIRRNSKIQGRV